MSPFLFFFHLMNNWPRLMLFAWNGFSSPLVPDTPLVSISYSESMIASNVTTSLSLCAAVNEDNARHFNWRLTSQNFDFSLATNSCSIVVQLKAKRNYTVEVQVTGLDGTVLLQVRQKLFTDSFWLVAIGDSFSSGEGNPGAGSQKLWLDDRCHRSKFAFPNVLFEKVRLRNPQRVNQFDFLSCSGATFETILSSRDKISQLDQLQQLVDERGFAPDVVVLTVGANDAGFAHVLTALMRGLSPQKWLFNMRLFNVAENLDTLAEKLTKLNVKRVILPLYPDITRNELGDIDANCDDFQKVSTAGLIQAEKRLFQPFKKLLAKKARQHGWTVVETIPKLFRFGGVCSKQSLIRSANESLRLQGSVAGSFHPNSQAHQWISEELLRLPLFS